MYWKRVLLLKASFLTLVSYFYHYTKILQKRCCKVYVFDQILLSKKGLIWPGATTDILVGFCILRSSVMVLPAYKKFSYVSDGVKYW